MSFMGTPLRNGRYADLYSRREAAVKRNSGVSLFPAMSGAAVTGQRFPS